MKLNNMSEREKEFVSTMAYLGLAYNRSFNEQELDVWYDILKEYPDEVLVRVVKDIIKTEKFLPSISKVVEECKKYKKLDRYEVLEQMRANNYFKTAEEYLKAKQWLEEGVMPEWFKQALKENYNILIDDSEGHYIKQDNNSQQVLLEGSENYVNEE